MAVDFSGVLGRIRSVNAQVVELYALKSSLQAFRSSLDASWRGSEVVAYDAAIDKLCARIDRAVQSCSDAASSANCAVLYASEVQATELANKGLEQI